MIYNVKNCFSPVWHSTFNQKTMPKTIEKSRSNGRINIQPKRENTKFRNIGMGQHLVAVLLEKSHERGPKLRVTKAVISTSYRFRSFAISIYMVLEHVKQWLLIWKSISSHLHRTKNWALHGQQSAVHFLSSKCGRNFPRNRLVFALLRGFCFCRFCSSLWILWWKLYSMVGFKARLDHPK